MLTLKQNIVFLIILLIINTIVYLKINRIKPLLTINSILVFGYTYIFNNFLILYKDKFISFFLKLDDNVYNIDNSLTYVKIIFVILICLINFFLVKVKKCKKNLKTNSFDYLINMFACLAMLSNNRVLKPILFVIYFIVLEFYLNVNFSYSRRK